MSTINRICFVWNADFSIASGIRAQKEAVEGQHSCTLCEIAYHRVRQTGDWKQYKNELAQRYAADIREPCRNQLKPLELEVLKGDFPAVLCRTPNGVVKLLGSKEIDGCDGQFALFKVALDSALASVS